MTLDGANYLPGLLAYGLFSRGSAPWTLLREFGALNRAPHPHIQYEAACKMAGPHQKHRLTMAQGSLAVNKPGRCKVNGDTSQKGTFTLGSLHWWPKPCHELQSMAYWNALGNKKMEVQINHSNQIRIGPKEKHPRHPGYLGRNTG